MTHLSSELLEIGSRLSVHAERGKDAAVVELLERLENATEKFGKAASGSWLGYHARIYYKDFQPPPPGNHFSQEWGMMDVHFSRGTEGHWVEYDPSDVKTAIYRAAGNPDLKNIHSWADEAAESFEDEKHGVLSLLATAVTETDDTFLRQLEDEVKKTKMHSAQDIIDALKPSGSFMTRDALAAGQGLRTPPHVAVFAEVAALRQVFSACDRLARLSQQAGSHLERKNRASARRQLIGTNVFIGHGGSPAWRQLKDFIQDRLRLPWDEFNRVPVAGITNITRLSEMLDAAAIAFLVMTGEDELKDGKVQARMNVIHEAGLFQGRLGFTRAIIVLEEGCEGFSNIEGLGQIRFPNGNIAAAFEEIRRVLEREGLLPS